MLKSRVYRPALVFNESQTTTMSKEKEQPRHHSHDTQVYGPWETEHITSLMAFQSYPGVEHYTCPQATAGGPLATLHPEAMQKGEEACKLLPLRNGLTCPYCYTTQDWAWAAHLDMAAWQEEATQESAALMQSATGIELEMQRDPIRLKVRAVLSRDISDDEDSIIRGPRKDEADWLKTRARAALLLRPAVLRFAVAMEERLYQREERAIQSVQPWPNRHPWRDWGVPMLIEQIKEETTDFETALADPASLPVVEYGADIANLCMMVADTAMTNSSGSKLDNMPIETILNLVAQQRAEVVRAERGKAATEAVRHVTQDTIGQTLARGDAAMKRDSTIVFMDEADNFPTVNSNRPSADDRLTREQKKEASRTGVTYDEYKRMPANQILPPGRYLLPGE